MFLEDSSAPSVRWFPEVTIATFYHIHPNVPGEGISLSSSRISRLFVHGISQGSRCLKKGEVVLYNCGVDDLNKGAGVNLDEKCEGEFGVTGSDSINSSSPTHCTTGHAQLIPSDSAK